MRKRIGREWIRPLRPGRALRLAQSARHSQRSPFIIRAQLMVSHDVPIQFLLTLPPRMAVEFEALEQRPRPEWFACSDSSGPPLGSGGGTANLLVEAWRQTGQGQSIERMVERQSQTHVALRRSESSSAGLRAPGQAAHARASLPLVARPATGPDVARSATGALLARPGPGRSTHRGDARQWRHAHPVAGRIAGVSGRGCARTRHVGHARKGEGLWRILHAARHAE